jgi:hypothetical protein
MTIQESHTTLRAAEPLYRAKGLVQDADIIAFCAELLGQVTIINILPDRRNPCDVCHLAREAANRDPYHHDMGE